MSTGNAFTPPSAEEFDGLIGDGYEVESILGVGGMGAVYQARQPRLDRIVAIKVLPPMDDDGINFAERFQLEAQTMARLDHPNIVHVYDFGETPAPGSGQADRLLYFVMEFIDGTDLHRLKVAGGLTTQHIFSWFPQICSALQYAHDHGVIHRDIKPANVMISGEGRVKIADFGLAKLSDTDLAEAAMLTQPGLAMGTPDYVAPEVLTEGAMPDHRIDLYSLGIMLYEILTGELPRGAWEAPSQKVEGLDPRFDALIETAIQRSPEKRFQSAMELAGALRRIATEPSGRLPISPAHAGARGPASPSGKRPHLMTGPVSDRSTSGTGPQKLVTGPINPAGATGQASSGSIAERAKTRAQQTLKAQATAAEASRKTRKRNALLASAAILVIGTVAAFKAFQSDPPPPAPPPPKPEPASSPNPPGQPPKPPSDPSGGSPADEPSDDDPPEVAETEIPPQPIEDGPDIVDANPDQDPIPDEPDPADAPNDVDAEAVAAEQAARAEAMLADARREVETIATRYADRLEDQNGSAYETGLETLNAGYLRALERNLTAAGNNPPLQEALRGEARLIQQDGRLPPPPDAENVPPQLASLRKTWRTEELKLARARAVVARPLLRAQLDDLHHLANRLVAEGKALATTPVGEARVAVESQLALLPAPKPSQSDDEEVTTDTAGDPTQPVLTEIPEYPFPPRLPERVGELITWYVGRTDPPTVLKQNVRVVSESTYTVSTIDEAGVTAPQGESEADKAYKPIPGLVSVATSHGFGMGLDGAGAVHTWGPPDSRNLEVPRDARDVVRIWSRGTSVASGLGVALDSKGALSAWGASTETVKNRLDSERTVADLAISHTRYVIVLRKTGSIDLLGSAVNSYTTEEERREISRIHTAVAVACSVSEAPFSLALLDDGSIFPWGWPKAYYPDGNPLPPDLPRDIDKIRVARPSGDKGAGAIHSRSRGWIFFGKDLDIERNNGFARDCYELKFRDGAVYALRPPTQDALTANPDNVRRGNPLELPSPDVIRVSPEGLGDTVTLDEALDSLEGGETLWLAPGDYPPSQHPDRPGIAYAGVYAVLKPDITICGHRSVIDSKIRVAVPRVTISGIRAKSVEINGSSRFTLLNSIVDDYSGDSCSEPYVENCLIGVISAGASTQSFRHVTVHAPKQGRVYRGEIVFDDCVLTGGAAFLFSFDLPATRQFLIRNSVLAPSSGFANVKHPDGRMATVYKQGDYTPNGITLEESALEPPVFLAADAGDYRLGENSPGKGRAEGGHDIGVHLDESGWPDSTHLGKAAPDVESDAADSPAASE